MGHSHELWRVPLNSQLVVLCFAVVPSAPSIFHVNQRSSEERERDRKVGGGGGGGRGGRNGFQWVSYVLANYCNKNFSHSTDFWISWVTFLSPCLTRDHCLAVADRRTGRAHENEDEIGVNSGAALLAGLVSLGMNRSSFSNRIHHPTPSRHSQSAQELSL